MSLTNEMPLSTNEMPESPLLNYMFEKAIWKCISEPDIHSKTFFKRNKSAHLEYLFCLLQNFWTHLI